MRGAARADAPDVVFNAAAYTDVDRAESEPELAHAANATAAEIVAAAAADAGAAVVHYSTDFVFDGARERPYDERDPPSPHRAIREVEGGGRRAGRARRTRGISSCASAASTGAAGAIFRRRSCARLRAGETIRADRDRHRLAHLGPRGRGRVGALAATEHHGLYHCTAQGETTWADFARAGRRPAGRAGRARAGGRVAELPLQGAAPAARHPRQPRAARDRPRHAVALAGRAARVRRRGDSDEERRGPTGRGARYGPLTTPPAGRAAYWRS